MKVVTTFHHPSSVLTSVKCQLGSRDTEHLIVGKLNRVVVYSIQPHGLQEECFVDIWGKVLSIKAIPIPRSSRSNLVLMIAHPDPELIFFNYIETEGNPGELVVRKKLPLFERTPRPAEFFNDILVHPDGQLAIACCYTGKVKVIKLKAGHYQEDFDASLPELNVFSITFLPTPESDYAIAILYLDNKSKIQLHARDIILRDSELSAHPSVLLHPTPLSDNTFPFPTEIVPRIVSVPSPDPHAAVDGDVFNGGVLVVGGRKLLLFGLAGSDAQTKQKEKRRRLEARKASSDANEAAKAREKDAEREARRRRPMASVEWPWSEVAAFCSIDREPRHFLIGDVYGKLALLSIDSVKEMGLILIPLGETSSPTTLTYLTSQALFVGSHVGDSQVIEISPTPVSSSSAPTLPIPPGIKTVSPSFLSSSRSKGKGREDADEHAMDIDDGQGSGANGVIVATKGSFLSVLDTRKNIAPIVDATLVDVDDIGQRQIITCSGGRNSGSLNIVRHGADFEELASIPALADSTNVWPVKSMFHDTVHSHLLVSTLQSTSFFRIDEAGGQPTLARIEGDSLAGLRLDMPTLAFANVLRCVKPPYPPNAPVTYEDSSLAVQVTQGGVFLLLMDPVTASYAEVGRWLPDHQGPIRRKRSEIVAASINPSQVVIALQGGVLFALRVAEKDVLQQRAVQEHLHEISAVSCVPLDSSRYFSQHIVVSYWGRNSIEIFKFTKSGDLESLCQVPQLPSLVRCLLLYNFGSDPSPKGDDHQPHLLAGLSDGSLVMFTWRDRELKEQKLVSLGHAPITFTPCTVEGRRTILAAGNRATLLSFDKKHLQFSPVSLKDISATSCFNTKAFESSLILATPTGISIGRIGDLNKLHIRTIQLGLDNPRRIVYEPIRKAFAVACTQTLPYRIGEVEVTKSSLMLIDGTTYLPISRFWCEDAEEITSVTTFSSKGEGISTLFCVGTYRYSSTETEPGSGRIVILDTISESKQSGSQFTVLTSVAVKGCVYALVKVGGCIAAAVNSSVELYQLDISDEDTSTGMYKLKHLSSWNHNYLVAHLATFDNYVVVGDQISSISLVKVIDNQLKSVARDYGPLWPVSVDASSETDIIAANDALNLYSFSLSRQPGRTVLERNGNWHLADFVTKFIRGSLSQDIEERAQFVPKELFFTSSGRIGILLDIEDPDPQLPILLTALERNLAYVIQGIGGENHSRYRAPRSTRGRTDADAAATGFLDGDFIERLVSLLDSREIVNKIMAGTNEAEEIEKPIGDLQKVVENLQSMH